MTNWFLEKFMSYGLEQTISEYMTNATMFLIIIGISFLAYVLLKSILLKILKILIHKSRLQLDDLLFRHRVFHQLTIIIPAFLLYALAPMLISGEGYLRRLAFCFIVFGVIRALDKFLNAMDGLYHKTEAAKTRPLTGMIQIIKIAAYIAGAIIIISVLMDRSPMLLLGGLGAASAVLMLIFQNTILGFVASIQLTENDMLRIGDWVDMPSHDANGHVMEISLHTVKVENWDKTITTIPTHAMVTNSFKNWRNMFDTGGRRITRSISIDMNSVRFCTQEMLERYEKVQYIQEYLLNKTNEIRAYNEENQIDFSSLVNGRRLTNLGTFRAYLEQYLKNHPKVHPDMLMLVRHLAPTAHGLPIELYLFTNTTKWVEYEAIQADIFDHILAIIPEFDLRVYQSPTSSDFAQAHLFAGERAH